MCFSTVLKLLFNLFVVLYAHYINLFLSSAEGLVRQAPGELFSADVIAELFCSRILHTMVTHIDFEAFTLGGSTKKP